MYAISVVILIGTALPIHSMRVFRAHGTERRGAAAAICDLGANRKTQRVQQRIEFPAKLTDIEAQRMRAKSVRIPAHRLKTENCLCQTRYILLVKENPGSPLNDRFQSAPRAISDRWAPGRRQFKRSHSEILFAGKQEGTAFTCIPSGFII